MCEARSILGFCRTLVSRWTPVRKNHHPIMKQFMTLAGLGLTIASSSWGQVAVDFRNSGVAFITPADRAVYSDRATGEKLTGVNYVAALWYVAGDDSAAVDGRISPERGLQAGGGRTFTFRV